MLHRGMQRVFDLPAVAEYVTLYKEKKAFECPLKRADWSCMQDSFTFPDTEPQVFPTAGGDNSQISHIHDIMQERGKFGYEEGSLDFSCTKIELVLRPGEYYEGSFGIEIRGGGPPVGQISSSDIRMECLTQELTGADEEIAFCFHGEHLLAGQVVKGNFYVVSSHGEYSLPYVVTVCGSAPPSTMGPVKNLFHFANLARENWEEAVALFYSPDFENILVENDRQYHTLYMGLSSNAGNEHNVDQFLTAIHKKQPIEYTLAQRELEIENPVGVTELEINVIRSGWGCTRLQVTVEGEFLFTEKQMLTGDDFMGSSCRLPVFVDDSMLHGGRNLGRVTLSDMEHRLEVSVSVYCGRVRAVAAGAGRERGRIQIQMMELYQSMRLKQISTSIWLKESEKLVETLAAMDEQDVSARLFQAQLLITNQRYHEAEWLLDHAMDLLEQGEGLYGTEPEELEAYYLYLTTLVRQDESYTAQVTERVRRIHHEAPERWRVAWLLLYLSEEHYRTAGAKWAFLERQSGYGCSSPLIYIEALQLLNMNPAMLRRLGSFELQVLVYGDKRKALSPELLEQMYYLAERVKDFSPQLYALLRSSYEKWPQERVLKEICRLLIKGSRVTPEAFEWYQRGVEAELRITRLYEYYMMALDLNREVSLPKAVLLYFSYQNNLDYAHSAYLYRYLQEHREEYIDLYADYRQQMEQFVVEQIQKGHMSRDLAFLYRELLTEDMIGEQTAEQLGRMIFAHEIRLSCPGIRRVVVCQPGNQMETLYPVTDGRAWFALYGSSCLVLLEDGDGCRYVQGFQGTPGIPCELDKLMVPGRHIGKVAEWVKNSPELDLYLYNGRELPKEPRQQQEARWLRIWRCEELEPEVRREACGKLMKCYYETDQVQALDTFLAGLSGELLGQQERQEAVRYMVIRGSYEQAYDWFCRYGLYELDSRILVELAGQMIQRMEYTSDRQLLKMAELIFQGKKYDGTILRYLCMHYQGPSREMRSIWKAARSFDVDCRELSERLLLQMLMTGSYVGEQEEIFTYYVTRGARPEVAAAYLAQTAHDYFVRGKEIQREVFREIMRLHWHREPVQRVCRLAFVKYYAQHGEEITEEIYRTARDFICELMEEGIRLKDFLAYQGMERELAPIMDRTFIEYYGHPDSVVRIHYLLSQENGDEDLYVTEEMRPVYGGVFSKEFVLFFGESLQYYIMEERGRVEQLMESGELRKGDSDRPEQEGRFARIDDMAVSRSLRDYDALDQQLEEFYRTEYFNRQLFRLK